MPITPLELYEVEETGELVLKHKYLKDALISHLAILIVNHNDKEITIWIGKGASTRAKFAAARSSRRFLTERSLSYRVRTCEEGEEPPWFQKLFEIKVAKRSRDEPPSLEVLSILNEIKKKTIPDGFEREACIISRDFFIPVEQKSSIMGKDISTIKFEKSTHLPEGFFNLPSQAYRPRFLVRNGKILGIDLLVKYDSSAKESKNIDIEEEAEDIDFRVQNLQQEGERKDKQIADLQHELSEKNQQITNMKSKIDAIQQKRGKIDKQIESLQEKDQVIITLQEEGAKNAQRIKTLRQEISKKDHIIDEFQQNVTEKDSEIKKMQKIIKTNRARIEKQQLEGVKREQQIEELQQNISKKDKQIETLQQTILKKEAQTEKLERRVMVKEQQIEDLQRKLSKKKQDIQERISIIEKMDEQLREKSRRVQELEAKQAND